MTLPLYVALEKIDRRLIEAAKDLYAGSVAAAAARIVGAVVGGGLGGGPGLIIRSDEPLLLMVDAGTGPSRAR